jgi:hypothetical protein
MRQAKNKPAVIQFELQQILLGFRNLAQQNLLNTFPVIHHFSLETTVILQDLTIFAL